MQTLLWLKTSLFSDQGESSRLAQRFVRAWRARHPASRLIVRDLAVEPVPHLDADGFRAFKAAPGERTSEQAAVVAYSDKLVDELRQADVLVLGLPMYNFGLPSALKAWIDHVARAGVTFRYTERGPVGLLGGKKAYVFAARGGVHAGTPRDTQTPYITTVLGFIGITDVEFVYAEGLSLTPPVRERSIAKAHAQIDRLVSAVFDDAQTPAAAD